MKSIQVITQEVDKEFKVGAFQCVGKIIKLMEKEQAERDTQVEETMRFSNENIQDLDIFFEEVATILIRKGYRVKTNPKQHIEVYFNVGNKGTAMYFKNIDKRMSMLTHEKIKTFEQFSKRTFRSENDIIENLLKDIEESIRKTVAFNIGNSRNVTEVTVKYDIPNEGDKSLEYYCENDEVLYRVVNVLEESGYVCETVVKTGHFPKLSESIKGTMRDGYCYRELKVKW